VRQVLKIKATGSLFLSPLRPEQIAAYKAGIYRGIPLDFGDKQSYERNILYF
jgi:hypothetical protein